MRSHSAMSEFLRLEAEGSGDEAPSSEEEEESVEDLIDDKALDAANNEAREKYKEDQRLEEERAMAREAVQERGFAELERKKKKEREKAREETEKAREESERTRENRRVERRAQNRISSSDDEDKDEEAMETSQIHVLADSHASDQGPGLPVPDFSGQDVLLGAASDQGPGLPVPDFSGQDVLLDAASDQGPGLPVPDFSAQDGPPVVESASDTGSDDDDLSDTGVLDMDMPVPSQDREIAHTADCDDATCALCYLSISLRFSKNALFACTVDRVDFVRLAPGTDGFKCASTVSSPVTCGSCVPKEAYLTHEGAFIPWNGKDTPWYNDTRNMLDVATKEAIKRDRATDAMTFTRYHLQHKAELKSHARVDQRSELCTGLIASEIHRLFIEHL